MSPVAVEGFMFSQAQGRENKCLVGPDCAPTMGISLRLEIPNQG